MAGFVTRSRRMLRLLGALDAVAASPSPVLIRGERGSGREYLARAIHDRRDGGSFVPVKCRDFAAVPPGLDASATLFLDGLQLLPPAGQLALHGFLTGTSRLGLPKVIASAGQGLEAGDFLRELLVLLDTISVTCPPLRDRGEDVVPLACLFLDELALEMNRDVRGFSPAALRRLESYHWPGNIRELRNVVERSLLFCRGSRVEAADVALPAEHAPFPAGAIPGGLELKDAVRRFKKSYVEDSIASSAGNKAEAARRLGIERTYLFTLIHDLGVEP